MTECPVNADACRCNGHETEIGQADVGSADTAVDVGVVSDTELDEYAGSRTVGRFTRPYGIEITVNVGHHIGRRIDFKDVGELFLGTQVFTQNKIAACEFQSRLQVIGEIGDIALQRQYAFTGMAAVDRSDTEVKVENRDPELLRVLFAKGIGCRGLTGFLCQVH